MLFTKAISIIIRFAFTAFILILIIVTVQPVLADTVIQNGKGAGALTYTNNSTDTFKAAGIVNNDTKGMSQSDITDKLLKNEQVDNLENALNEYLKDKSGLFGESGNFDVGLLLKNLVSGKVEFNAQSLLKTLVIILFKEVGQNMKLLAAILSIALLSALITILKPSFAAEGVRETAFFACFAAIIVLMATSLKTVTEFALGAVDEMTSFMYATSPLLFGLLISGGNIFSEGMLKPVVLLLIQITSVLMKNVFLPAILFSSVISLVNNLSDQQRLRKLSDFIRKTAVWGMGLTMTLFIALIAIQGPIGAAVDGISGKAAKLALGTFIPVVGGYLADAADTVIGCTLLVRNAAGIASMFALIVICIFPLLKMASVLIMFRIAGALSEIVCDKRISEGISSIADSISHMLGITAATAFLFLISIAAIAGASNISAMIR